MDNSKPVQKHSKLRATYTPRGLTHYNFARSYQRYIQVPYIHKHNAHINRMQLKSSLAACTIQERALLLANCLNNTLLAQYI